MKRSLLLALAIIGIATGISFLFSDESWPGYDELMEHREELCAELRSRTGSDSSIDALFVLALMEPEANKRLAAAERLRSIAPRSPKTARALYAILSDEAEFLSPEKLSALEAGLRTNATPALLGRYLVYKGIEELKRGNDSVARSLLAGGIAADPEGLAYAWDRLIATHLLACSSRTEYDSIDWNPALLPQQTADAFVRLRLVWDLPDSRREIFRAAIRADLTGSDEAEPLLASLADDPTLPRQLQAWVSGRRIDSSSGDLPQRVDEFVSRHADFDTVPVLSVIERLITWNPKLPIPSSHPIWADIARFLEQHASRDFRAAMLYLRLQSAKEDIDRILALDRELQKLPSDHSLQHDHVEWMSRYLADRDRSDDAIALIRSIPPQERSSSTWSTLTSILQRKLDPPLLIQALDERMEFDLDLYTYGAWEYPYLHWQASRLRDNLAHPVKHLTMTKTGRGTILAVAFLVIIVAAMMRARVIRRNHERALVDRFRAVQSLGRVFSAVMLSGAVLLIVVQDWFPPYAVFVLPLEGQFPHVLTGLITVSMLVTLAQILIYPASRPLVGHTRSTASFAAFSFRNWSLAILPLSFHFLAYDLAQSLLPLEEFSIPTLAARAALAALVGLPSALIALSMISYTLDPFPSGDVRRGIETLAARVGLTPIDLRLLRIPGIVFVNAFATLTLRGRPRVALSESLIQRFPEIEILAVAGHELAHVKLRHVEKQLLIQHLFLACAIAAAPLADGVERLPSGDVCWAAAFLSSLLLIRPLVSRRHERQADLLNVQEFCHPWDWCSALLRLQIENFQLADADHATHPSIRKRLEMLDASFRNEYGDEVVIDLRPVIVADAEGIRPAGPGHDLAVAMAKAEKRVSLAWPVQSDGGYPLDRFKHAERRFYFTRMDGPGKLAGSGTGDPPSSDRPQVAVDAAGVFAREMRAKFGSAKKVLWFADQVSVLEPTVRSRLLLAKKPGQEWLVVSNAGEPLAEFAAATGC